MERYWQRETFPFARCHVLSLELTLLLVKKRAIERSTVHQGHFDN